MEQKALTTLPGTRDILPDEIRRWHIVEDQARKVLALYRFQEIRTPLIEATELFARGIGGDTDIVRKEMYTFTDQGGTSITLRPEMTASVVRAYIEHHMYRFGAITKLYYIGPMFRHEKKQRGRWRQFYQIGAEILGSDDPSVEAEVIEMVLRLLEALQVEARLLINSVGCRNCRPGFIAILKEAIDQDLGQFCADCRRRAETNTLRVLDCKVEGCQPYIDRLPRITDHLCQECSAHFRKFQDYLSDAGIRYEIVPRLVRGLDYYVRTAFEMVSGELGSQNALVGGGRYDGLSEVLGGPPVQGFGFALGLDRLVMILPDSVAASSVDRPEVFLVCLSEEAFKTAISITRRLRRQGISCHLGPGAGSLKSQMRMANRMGARHVLIIGQDELARQRYSLKRMEDSKQWEVSLPELSQYLQSLSAARDLTNDR